MTERFSPETSFRAEHCARSSGDGADLPTKTRRKVQMKAVRLHKYHNVRPWRGFPSRG
jgi:hypothetical protein